MFNNPSMMYDYKLYKMTNNSTLFSWVSLSKNTRFLYFSLFKCALHKQYFNFGKTMLIGPPLSKRINIQNVISLIFIEQFWARWPWSVGMLES